MIEGSFEYVTTPSGLQSFMRMRFPTSSGVNAASSSLRRASSTGVAKSEFSSEGARRAATSVARMAISWRARSSPFPWTTQKTESQASVRAIAL